MMAQASQGEKRKRSPRKNPSPVKRLRVSSELGCEVGARWDVQTGQVLDFDIKEEPDDEEFLQVSWKILFPECIKDVSCIFENLHVFLTQSTIWSI